VVERPRAAAIESQGRGGADAHPGVGLDLTSGDRDRGKAAVHEGGGTDRQDPPVSVPQREGRGGPDERGPLVCPREGRGSARSACAGRARVGRHAGQVPGRPLRKKIFFVFFFFFFLCNFCLMFEVE